MDENYIKQLLKTEGQEIKITEKKMNIILAAIEIFSEKGYAATSTSEIAKRAGVAEGTIFRHYDSKKDLLLGIVKPGIIKLAIPYFASQMVEDVFRDEFTGLEDVLRAFITNRVEFAKKNIPMLKIILQEMAFHQEIKKTFEETFLEQVYPKVNEIILSLQKNEQLKQDFSVPETIRYILSTVLGFIITRFLVLPNADWDEEKEIDHMIRFIMDGISE